MALSFSAVQSAYQVLNEIKRSTLPELQICSYPEDMSKWSSSEKENPQLNTIYGFDRKYDSGWENLCFFVKDPSEELRKQFDELSGKVPNSSFSEPYHKNEKLYVFGWF